MICGSFKMIENNKAITRYRKQLLHLLKSVNSTNLVNEI